MNHRRTFLGLAFALLLHGPRANAQADHAELRQLLAPSTIAVEVLELWSPPRLEELNARITAAAQKNPAWFRSHVESAQPGQPLAYDARLGVTEPEFREYLQLAQNLTMRPARSTVIEVVTTPTGWRFDEKNALDQLRGVEIDTVAGVVRTPFGALASAAPIRASAAQAATGPWEASRWSLQSPGVADGTGVAATFALGRHVETGRLFLYYQVRELRAGAIAQRVDLVLRGAPY